MPMARACASISASLLHLRARARPRGRAGGRAARLRGDLAREAEGGAQRAQVLLGREEVLLDARPARADRPNAGGSCRGFPAAAASAGSRSRRARPAASRETTAVAPGGAERKRTGSRAASIAGLALEERHEAARHVGRRTAAEEVGARHAEHQPVDAREAHERPRLLALMREHGRVVVLQVAADAGERRDRRDADLRQLRGIADARTASAAAAS